MKDVRDSTVSGEPYTGQIINTADSCIKVMAVADGYVMARHKGCIPFCKSVKDFKKFIGLEVTVK